VGLALSVGAVRDTGRHVELEARSAGAGGAGSARSPRLRELLTSTVWRSRPLSSVNHAGLVNNLNDGVAWGLFPLFFAAGGLSVARIGVLAFLYPAVWGAAQLWTGGWSDRVGRKPLIVWGMVVQGVALVGFAVTAGFAAWGVAAVLLGLGTAMVYPTLLAAVGDVAPPAARGSAVGVYRLWRDGGYVVGALGAGLIADALGMRAAIGAVALLTLCSGVLVGWRMPETMGAVAGR
jgi:MFS family permease